MHLSAVILNIIFLKSHWTSHINGLELTVVQSYKTRLYSNPSEIEHLAIFFYRFYDSTEIVQLLK